MGKLWCKVNEASNFFKHANKDPESFFEFNELLNDAQILYCCIGYAELTGQASPIMNNFAIWIIVNEPDLMVEGDFKYNLMANKPHEDFKNLDKIGKKKIGKLLLEKVKA